jgi:hypothetical protein
VGPAAMGLMAVASCSSSNFTFDGTPSSTGGARRTCSDFNMFYSVTVKSFPRGDGGGLDAASDAADEDADASDVEDANADASDSSTSETEAGVSDAGSTSTSTRDRVTYVLIRQRAPTGLTMSGSRAFIDDDAGDLVLDQRPAIDNLEVQVDTTASNGFVLRITSAVSCRANGLEGVQPVLLDIRLLDDGRVNTVRASIADQPDVPVPVEP